MLTNTSAEEIVVGQRIHCILYGGTTGTVVAIHGEQTPGSVRSIGGGVGVMGGSAELDILWDGGAKSFGIPEALARCSVQWKIYPEISGPDVIALRWTDAAIFEATAKAKADEAKASYLRAFEQAIKDYPHLTRVGEKEHGGGQFAAKNIRKELKAAWPKLKFSVKSDYNSLSVSWTDGPTRKQVEDIVEKYKCGGFDSMQDLTTYDPTAFTNLFGGATYLSYDRDISEPLQEKALDALYDRLPGNLRDVPRPTAQELNRWSSPEIPDFGRITVGGATRAIADAWDDVGKVYLDQKRYYETRWIVIESDGSFLCKPLV